ncbi:MAG: hypothetical protein JNJ46_02915 [Myxococcales bacterium]|nr:hypothetical protein [Myxococcales bacterium]
MRPRQRPCALPRWGVLCVAALALLAACAQDDAVAVRRCSGSDCAPVDPAFCSGSGPVIRAAQDASRCGGALLAQLLPMALCSCSDVQGGDLQSDSFDSMLAPYASGGTRGDIGVQGLLRAERSWDIGGALFSTAAAGVLVQAQAVLRTQGALQVQGPLSGAAVITHSDASVGGAIQLVDLRVDGTLTTPAMSSVVVSGQKQVAFTAQQDVTVAAPCPCELDPYVSGPINDLQARNDNASLGLSSQQLELYRGDVQLDLPCGRYYFSRMAGAGSLRLRILGRVELAVAGGIEIGGGWTVSLEPSAELDLYVHGDVAVAGPLALGDPAAPPRLRWFPGGVDALSFSGGGYLSAALLGRRRAWMSSTPMDVYGAVVVDSLQINTSLRVHRDLSLQRLGGGCRTP